MKTVFTQTIIALVWDFDKTLIPGYMQRPLFEKFNVDEAKFWSEVNQLEAHYRDNGCEQISGEMAYLNHVLDYTRQDIFSGLNNQLLGELGESLDFYPGLPDFFAGLKEHITTNERFRHHDIVLENYIVSTGFTRTIRGSKIADYVDGVWGCEFVESDREGKSIIDQITYVLDNTTKTRAVFEINKGVNKHPDEIDVNAAVKQEDRRIPFQNMIYIADGPSDVPVFSVVKINGGRTYGVYNSGHDKEFQQVKRLQRDGRIDGMGPADYTPGSATFMWLRDEVSEIANRIVSDREKALGDKVGTAPKHIND